MKSIQYNEQYNWEWWYIMTIQRDDREYSASYAEDLLSAEKNLFLLRCIRNSIQKKYDESTDTSLSSNA